jgi:aminoglycoside phosphotransferase
MHAPPSALRDAEAAAVIAEVTGDRVMHLETVRSGKRSAVYRVATRGLGPLHVKLGRGLRDEADRLAWAQRRLPVPELVAYRSIGTCDVLVTGTLPGRDLATGPSLRQPRQTIDRAVEALDVLRAVDATDCPFGAGSLLVHGDYCLPNVIYRNGKLTGFIDLGALGRGEPDVDIAAAVASTTFNFGREWALHLLRRLGDERADDGRVSSLIDRYERPAGHPPSSAGDAPTSTM